MTQMTDAELFALMDTVAEMRDDLEHRVTVARKCSREANFKKYHTVKEQALYDAKRARAMEMLKEAKERCEQYDRQHNVKIETLKIEVKSLMK